MNQRFEKPTKEISERMRRVKRSGTGLKGLSMSMDVQTN